MTILEGEGTNPIGLGVERKSDGFVQVGSYLISSEDWDLAIESAGPPPTKKRSTSRTKDNADASESKA